MHGLLTKMSDKNIDLFHDIQFFLDVPVGPIYNFKIIHII